MTDEEKRSLKSSVYRVVNYEDDIHCMPQDDWFEHQADVNCPCAPYPDPKNLVDIQRGYASKYVWVHKQIKNHKESCN